MNLLLFFLRDTEKKLGEFKEIGKPVSVQERASLARLYKEIGRILDPEKKKAKPKKEASEEKKNNCPFFGHPSICKFKGSSALLVLKCLFLTFGGWWGDF